MKNEKKKQIEIKEQTKVPSESKDSSSYFLYLTLYHPSLRYLKKFGTSIFENYEKEEKIFADFIVKYGRNYANKEEYEMRF